jgi:hypothetical protein
VSRHEAGRTPSLGELRDTLHAIGECARPLTALAPQDLARQAAGAYAHASRLATRAAAENDPQPCARMRARRRHLAAALDAARDELLERTGAGGSNENLALSDDEEGAYRSAAAYAAAAGCVLPAADAAQRSATELLISGLTLAVGDLAARQTPAAPPSRRD